MASRHGRTFETSLDSAVAPLVLGIDVGSTATRAGLYDARGLPVDGHKYKVPHAFTTATDGTVVLDPQQVVGEVAENLDAITPRLPSDAVAGVAIDTFASSLVGVAEDGAALTPCYTYADSRCAPQLATLLRLFDIGQIHDLTGTRLHTSYLAPRLRWLRETEPATFKAVHRWMSIGEFIQLQLTGATAAGTSTAAWTGLLDRRTGAWAPALLDAAGVDESRLSPIQDPDSPVAGAGTARWGALATARWFAPIADGLASNVGSGATDPHSIGLAAATSGAMRVLVRGTPQVLPDGLWCYRISRTQSIAGGALNDVGRIFTWLDNVVRLPAGSSLDAIARRAPEEATPLVLPFLTGERSTGWRGDARAVVTELGAATDGAALARGALEGIALAYARVHDQLLAANPSATRVIGSGRVTGDIPGLLDVVADVLGVPVEQAVLGRATLRGTVLLALESLAPGVERAPTPMTEPHVPRPEHTTYFAGRKERFTELYRRVFT